jgi:hypothetical protein
MENENLKNFPYGRKEAARFVVPSDVSAGAGDPMPPGILPPSGAIGGGVSSPYMPTPAVAREKARR